MFLCIFFFQLIVIVAAFIFAGVGFYSFSPNVLDSEFCCKENHNVEGKDFKLYLSNAYINNQFVRNFVIMLK